MRHYTPLVTLGLYLTLVGIGASLVGSPSHTLWSVRYLWQMTAQPLAMFLPASAGGDSIPAVHRSGHVWQARALLADGQTLQAEAILQPALAAGDYDAQRLQAEILVKRGNIAGAVQLWAQVGAVDDILAAAWQAGQSGQNDDALNAYRIVYTLAPERTVLPFAQFLRQNTKDLADAETLLRQYIEVMPNSPYFVQWLRELGTLYQSQKAWHKALAIYTQLVAALPDSAPDWVQLGWLYYERDHNTEKALAQFQQAIALAPIEGDGYYAIGSLLSREQRYQEADLWFVKAIEREPDQQWWWLGRANAAQQAGNFPLAAKLYTSLQLNFPTFVQGYYQAAWTYKLANERSDAISAIEAALALLALNDGAQRQVNADIYARAGQLYEWAGDLQKAVTAYEQADKLDPHRKGVQDALKRLYGTK